MFARCDVQMTGIAFETAINYTTYGTIRESTLISHNIESPIVQTAIAGAGAGIALSGKSKRIPSSS